MTLFVISGILAVLIEMTLCWIPLSHMHKRGKRIRAYISVACGCWAYIVLSALVSCYFTGLMHMQ